MNNQSIITISIAKDFSMYPAGRYPEDGDFNGTTFRREHLVPPLKDKQVLRVIFDGVAGFGSSFLEEAFGGLVREEDMSKAFLDEHLQLSTEEPELEDFISLTKQYIDGAGK